MRILHTSDWHLGRPLEGHSRQPEQEQFVAEICDLAREHGVHLVLIAGDVFDTYNPPAWAEQLFCRAIERLADGGRRAVVVIAGNHDSPDRLSAVRPLAERLGILIYGLPLEETAPLAGGEHANSVQVVAGGAGWVELAVAGCEHNAVISLLPYPSEARLGRLLSEQLEERALHDAYSQLVGELLAKQAANYRADTVNLAVSHLFLQGGLVTDSERPIEVGGACSVATTHLPPTAQYIALGHLHRPQQVKAAAIPTYYSGSPLAYSFSEASQLKVVMLIEAVPGETVTVSSLPLSAGLPLERWVCTGGLVEAWQRIEASSGRPAWVDLELHVAQPLGNDALMQLRQAWPTIVNIRTVLPSEALAEQAERLANLSLPELFERFHRQRRNGAPPSPELVQLFVELANAVAVGDEPGGELV